MIGLQGTGRRSILRWGLGHTQLQYPLATPRLRSGMVPKSNIQSGIGQAFLACGPCSWSQKSPFPFYSLTGPQESPLCEETLQGLPRCHFSHVLVEGCCWVLLTDFSGTMSGMSPASPHNSRQLLTHLGLISEMSSPALPALEGCMALGSASTPLATQRPVFLMKNLNIFLNGSSLSLTPQAPSLHLHF